MSKKLYVDNFAATTTVQALRELFSAAGTVESVVIPPRASIKDDTDHAFIVMESEMGALEAIRRLNNTLMNGSRLTVTRAGPVAAVSAGFHGGTPRMRPRS